MIHNVYFPLDLREIIEISHSISEKGVERCGNFDIVSVEDKSPGEGLLNKRQPRDLGVLGLITTDVNG